MELGPNQLKWLEAMESGEYRQGFGVLYSTIESAYCCLGVAKKVLDLPEDSIYCLEKSYREIGLKSSEGMFCQFVKKASADGDGDISYDSLVSLNDSEEFSFKDIAQIIRDNPENVFERSV